MYPGTVKTRPAYPNRAEHAVRTVENKPECGRNEKQGKNGENDQKRDSHSLFFDWAARLLINIQHNELK